MGQEPASADSISLMISGFTVTVFTVTVGGSIVEDVSDEAVQSVAEVEEWTVDELARRVDLPVRTIREYQTLGLLPPPRRSGRVGLYGRSHLRRLDLIARLRNRGHSLAGIGDLMGSWSDGSDLGEVLGLDPDELVHIDEPGAPASLDQLAILLPDLVPHRLDELVAAGLVEPCGPERYCVPSPSLLQLTVDALGAGLDADEVLGLLVAIGSAADAVTTAVLDRLNELPAEADPDVVAAFLQRGRGLLAHGMGRLTLHRIGRSLGIGDEVDVSDRLRDIAEGTVRP